MTRRGFPHSDTPGSQLVCSSPRLIAADRVLHRLLAPRHSPYALSSLTIGMPVVTSIDAGSKPSAWQTSRPLPSTLTHTLRVFCGSEKLPFAGYSVVKERWLAISGAPNSCLTGPRNTIRSCSRSERLTKDGGEYRARTGDLLVANQALSQLS